VSNLGTPFKIIIFGHSNGSSQARRWRHLVYVNASYPITAAGISELRFCLQWASNMHRRHAFPFALARLSCKNLINTIKIITKVSALLLKNWRHVSKHVTSLPRVLDNWPCIWCSVWPSGCVWTKGQRHSLLTRYDEARTRCKHITCTHANHQTAIITVSKHIRQWQYSRMETASGLAKWCL